MLDVLDPDDGAVQGVVVASSGQVYVIQVGSGSRAASITLATPCNTTEQCIVFPKKCAS